MLVIGRLSCADAFSSRWAQGCKSKADNELAICRTARSAPSPGHRAPGTPVGRSPSERLMPTTAQWGQERRCPVAR